MYRILRTALFIIGIILLFLSFAMIFPIIVNFSLHYECQGFCQSFIITVSFSIFCLLFGKLFIFDNNIDRRSGRYIIIVFSIIVLSHFSAMPFILSELKLSYVDALFEAVSGITTTGATVLVNLQEKSPGILLWRVLLNMIGALGFIAIITPFLRKVHIYNFYTLEFVESSEKFIPTMRTILLYISSIYFLLIILCAILYYVMGMSLFDSICHSMSTVTTGGFTNYDTSLSYFNSISIEVIATIFMFLSSLPLVFYYRILKEYKFYDEQVSLIISIISIMTIISFFYIFYHDVSDKMIESKSIIYSLRYALFTVISFISSTGFVNYNYDLIPPIAMIIIMLTMIGGCTGSSSGGVKIYRILVLFKKTYNFLIHLLYPNRINSFSFNGDIIDNSIINEVSVFFFLYISIFILSSMIISFSGLDIITSFSVVLSSLNNVGTGVGETIGAYGNSHSLLPWVKLLLSIMMICGRLDIIPVFIFLFVILSKKY